MGVVVDPELVGHPIQPYPLPPPGSTCTKVVIISWPFFSMNQCTHSKFLQYNYIDEKL